LKRRGGKMGEEEGMDVDSIQRQYRELDGGMNTYRKKRDGWPKKKNIYLSQAQTDRCIEANEWWR
jgi:hypothetical protein